MFTLSSCLSLLKNMMMKYSQRFQNVRTANQHLTPGQDKLDNRETRSTLILKISKVLSPWAKWQSQTLADTNGAFPLSATGWFGMIRCGMDWYSFIWLAFPPPKTPIM